VIQKLSEGFQKPLTEKWKHLKKIVLPGGVHPVRNSSGALPPPGIIIKPDSAAKKRGIISNGVNIISYCALCSARCRPVRRFGVLDFKMKSEVTALFRGLYPNNPMT
jgi:hypothetical protein